MQLLTSELKLQEKHLSLLRNQKAALIACNRKAFCRLYAEYEDILNDLEMQDEDRKRCFRDGARLKTEIAAWPEQDRVRAERAMMRLHSLMREIDNQSKQNVTLISNDLNLMNFQLDLFTRAINKGFQYASSGAAAPVQANRLINQMA